MASSPSPAAGEERPEPDSGRTRKLSARRTTIHGIKARRAFADGVALLGIVNAAMGFLIEWGRVDGVSVKGIALVETIFSSGPESILFGAREPGAGFFVVALPLAVTLPAMAFFASRIRPAGRTVPFLCILSGSWASLYLLYSVLVSGALAGYHGIGFGVSLLGFTLIAVGGALRWPDSTREYDRRLAEAAAGAGRAGAIPERLRGRPAPAREAPPRKAPDPGRLRPPRYKRAGTARSGWELLASLLLPPPVFVFPLPRRISLGSLPPATLILMALNVLCFLCLDFRNDFATALAPALFFDTADFRIAPLFTSLFMHFNAVHLLVNMLVLFVVGCEVEDVLGRPLFTILYLAGGVLANAVLGLAFMGHSIICAGASGSIAALMGLMLAAMPGRRIRLWFFQVVRHRCCEFRAGWVLSLYLVFQTVMALLQAAERLKSPIGYWDHLGGMISGMIAAFLVKRKIAGRLEPGDGGIGGLALPLALAAGAVAAGLVSLLLKASG